LPENLLFICIFTSLSAPFVCFLIAKACWRIKFGQFYDANEEGSIDKGLLSGAARQAKKNGKQKHKLTFQNVNLNGARIGI